MACSTAGGGAWPTRRPARCSHRRWNGRAKAGGSGLMHPSTAFPLRPPSRVVAVGEQLLRAAPLLNAVVEDQGSVDAAGGGKDPGMRLRAPVRPGGDPAIGNRHLHSPYPVAADRNSRASLRKPTTERPWFMPTWPSCGQGDQMSPGGASPEAVGDRSVVASAVAVAGESPAVSSRVKAASATIGKRAARRALDFLALGGGLDFVFLLGVVVRTACPPRGRPRAGMARASWGSARVRVRWGPALARSVRWSGRRSGG